MCDTLKKENDLTDNHVDHPAALELLKDSVRLVELSDAPVVHD